MYGTNPRAPPLVKMDIEGYEWDMIPEVVHSRFRPLQLTVAFVLYSCSLSFIYKHKCQALPGLDEPNLQQKSWRSLCC